MFNLETETCNPYNDRWHGIHKVSNYAIILTLKDSIYRLSLSVQPEQMHLYSSRQQKEGLDKPKYIDLSPIYQEGSQWTPEQKEAVLTKGMPITWFSAKLNIDVEAEANWLQFKLRIGKYLFVI